MDIYEEEKKGGYNHLNGRKSTVSDFIPFNPIPPFSIFLLPLTVTTLKVLWNTYELSQNIVAMTPK